MFWPPTFRANNKVSLTDIAFIREGGDARHGPFVMDACFLAPWLARADQDTKWQSGSPMCRVLLCSDSGNQIYSANEDGVGSCFQLTDGPLGRQIWEIVSAFDWYDESSLSMIGKMCWARLIGEGETSAAMEVLYHAEVHSSGMATDWGFVPADITEECLVILAVAWEGDDNNLTALTLDGVDILADVILTTGESGGSGDRIQIALIARVCSPATLPAFVFTTAAATQPTAEIVYLRGATGLDNPTSCGASNYLGSASPTCTQATGNTHADCYCFAFCAISNGDGPIVVDAPFADLDIEVTGEVTSRGASHVVPVAVNPIVNWSGITPTKWFAVIASFR